MDGVAPGEWGPAAEVQLCYEIKVRCVTGHVLHAGVLTLRCVRQTFVLAGHETSAAMLTWSLYELSRNPVRRTELCASPCVLNSVLAGHRGQGGGRGYQGVWRRQDGAASRGCRRDGLHASHVEGVAASVFGGAGGDARGGGACALVQLAPVVLFTERPRARATTRSARASFRRVRASSCPSRACTTAPTCGRSRTPFGRSAF